MPGTAIGMIFAIFFLLSTAITGTAVIRLLGADLRWEEELAGGLVTGIVGVSWLSFICSSLTGRLLVWPVALVLLLFAVSIVFFNRQRLNSLKDAFKHTDRFFWVIVLFWAIFLVKLFSQMLVENSQGIWAGGSNVWGDWAGHIGYIANWIYGSNLPPQNPWYAGIKLSYPFLFDFTSAMLVRLGMTIPQSMEIPGAIFSITLVVLLARLTTKLTRSRVAGAISVFIFMFSGGLGFVYLLPAQPDWLQNLFPAPAGGVKELTHVAAANIQWINFVISEMVPQRGILIGTNVALLIFLLWERGGKENNRNHFLLSGILAGLVPFFHTHTFIVLMMVSGIFFLMKPKMYWWFFFIPAVVLALPQLIYFLPQVIGYKPGFIRWRPGWLVDVQKDNWIWFWIKNLGIMAILIPISLLWSWMKKRKLFFYYLPFLLVFILANLWIFQPWENDNSKLLRFWYLASTVLVAGCLAGWAKNGIYKKIIATVLFVSVILAGAIDAGSWLNFDKNKIRMWDKNDIELARFIREITPKDAVFLTVDAHNHWVVDLAGRKIIMGFRGWLWSWGINYQKREKDVLSIFRGGPNAKQLLEKYKIDYVIVGPAERNAFKANLAFFINNFPLILDKSNHKIFKII